MSLTRTSTWLLGMEVWGFHCYDGLLRFKDAVESLLHGEPCISRDSTHSSRKRSLNCNKRLTDQGRLHNSPEMLANRWREKLYSLVDGAGFRDSGKTSHQHQWITDGTRLLSGKDYINCNKLRIGAIPTQSRTARGRTRNRHCRAGYAAQETLNHILQICHRTHAARIKRHDVVVKYIERKIKPGGYKIHLEHYHTSLSLRERDYLVATLGQTAIVVDAQVVGEQANLATAHENKKRYYQQQEVIKAINN